MAEQAPDAFDVALAALGRKERSSAELAVWLERRGYDTEQVGAAIRGLMEAGALDDEGFARRYAEDKRQLRGWGSARIRDALGSRGVEPRLIDAALEQDSEPAEVSRATQLLLSRGQPLAGEAARARALGYLTRRGYGYEVAYEAIRQATRQAA